MTTPLALLHGWGSSPRIWDGLRPLLDERPLLAPVLPGHPDGPAAEGGIDQWADQVLATLPAQADLCGWSLGAILALAIAARAPQRVRRVVLIAGTACFVRRDGWPGGLEAPAVGAFEQAFRDDPGALMARFHALQVLGDERRRGVLESLRRSAAPFARNPTGLAAGLRVLAESDLRAGLATITHPVRLLHGARDALMPPGSAEALAERLKDGRLTLFDDCGHAPHLSRPADCAVLIGGFLDE